MSTPFSKNLNIIFDTVNRIFKKMKRTVMPDKIVQKKVAALNPTAQKKVAASDKTVQKKGAAVRKKRYKKPPDEKRVFLFGR